MLDLFQKASKDNILLLAHNVFVSSSHNVKEKYITDVKNTYSSEV